MTQPTVSGSTNDLEVTSGIVAALHKTRDAGRDSGLDVRVPTFHVFTLRDHMIVAMRAFAERAEALEAAGLSE